MSAVHPPEAGPNVANFRVDCLLELLASTLVQSQAQHEDEEGLEKHFQLPSTLIESNEQIRSSLWTLDRRSFSAYLGDPKSQNLTVVEDNLVSG